MRFCYVHPQVDSVALDNQVAPVDNSTPVATIAEAIELYLVASRVQFLGQHGAQRKARWLDRFLNYLKEQHHSGQLTDLALRDGQAFLDTLGHAYHGISMSVYTKTRYKSTLRSFSRFLVKSHIIEEDVFFLLKVI
jgi:site-specific recombinase XerD